MASDGRTEQLLSAQQNFHPVRQLCPHLLFFLTHLSQGDFLYFAIFNEQEAYSAAARI